MLQIIRPHKDIPSSGEVFVTTDPRKGAALTLARWVSANKDIEWFIHPGVLNDSLTPKDSKFPALESPLEAVLSPAGMRQHLSQYLDPSRSDGDRPLTARDSVITPLMQALTSSPLLMETRPLSWHLDAAARQNTESVLAKLLRPAAYTLKVTNGTRFKVVANAARAVSPLYVGGNKAWGYAYPIREAEVVYPEGDIVNMAQDALRALNGGDIEAALSLTDWTKSSKNSTHGPSLADVLSSTKFSPPGTVLGLGDAAALIALIDGWGALLHRKPVTEPSDLGFKEKEEQKADKARRSKMEHVRVGFLLMAFGYIKHLYQVRIFERFLSLPFVAEALEEAASDAEIAEFKKALKELIALPVPPIVAEMARCLNPITGADLPGWGRNPVYPYVGELYPSLHDPENVKAARREGQMATIDRELFSVRKDFRLASVSSAEELLERKEVPALALIVQYVLRLWRDHFRDTGGSGLTVNQIKKHYLETASMCGWTSWSEEAPTDGAFLAEEPVVMGIGATDRAVTDSLDFAHRRVWPIGLSYGEPVLFRQGEDTDGKLFKIVSSRQKRIFAGEKLAEIPVCNFEIAHKLRTVWVTSAHGARRGTLGELLDPTVWLPLSPDDAGMVATADQEELLATLGTDVDVRDNSLARWAAGAGVSLTEMARTINTYREQWSHLFTPAAFGDLENDSDDDLVRKIESAEKGKNHKTLVYTSTEVKNVARNIRVRIPMITLGAPLLMRDGRTYDALDPTEDVLVITRGRPSVLHSTTSSSMRDLQRIGVTPDKFEAHTL
jgi:hypothetical protein